MDKQEEFKKQFRVILFEDRLLIATSLDQRRSFEARLNIPGRRKLKIGWNDWIETSANALNYHECRGVCILFGIDPPSFDELYNLLNG